ncbi:unnamed protein product [Notodromas monacha]|uniref:Ribosome biogenesis protein NOP53 n=1 Tax=Notodromas monacha TaxID=399045 RepID=A0A7R9BRZ7_9CRUS|nr:unnamed protein product [Notodromas monacha]CAG0919533.1 unnamed protein product [Notodromas monacha]
MIWLSQFPDFRLKRSNSVAMKVSVKTSAKKSVMRKKKSKDVPLVEKVSFPRVSSKTANIEPGRPVNKAHLSKNKKKSMRRVNVDDVEFYGGHDVQNLQKVLNFLFRAQLGRLALRYVKTDEERVAKAPWKRQLDERKRLRAMRSLEDRDATWMAKANALDVEPYDVWSKEDDFGFDDHELVTHNFVDCTKKKIVPYTGFLRPHAMAIMRVLYNELFRSLNFYLEAVNVYYDTSCEKTIPFVVGDVFLMQKCMDVFQLIPKPPRSIHKNLTMIPKVETPHPGMSYNPSIKDHSALLETAAEIEIRKEREEEKWHKKTYGMFPKTAPTEQDKLMEMSEGLFVEDEEEEEKETAPEEKKEDEPVAETTIDEEGEMVYKAPIRAEDKKTKTKRNKERNIRAKAREAAVKKALQAKESAVLRLKQIRKEIKTKEKEIQSNIVKRRLKTRQKELFGTKKLSKTPFEDADLPVKFVEEVSGSLRQLRPEGHLLVDRFKSLQKRNVIETRVREKPGRRKIKRFLSRDHRKFAQQQDIDQKLVFKKLKWHR